MAIAVLHPDPGLFAPGQQVDVRVMPDNAPAGFLPTTSVLSSPTVASNGTLEVTGLTEGKRYEARATVSGNLHQLIFAPEIATATSGLDQAAVEALIAEKAVSTASPAFTGAPTAPTATPGTNSTQLATTAYADAATAVEKGRAETAEALKAPLASPALTGTPAAPTAAKGTSTTQLATTAFAKTVQTDAEAGAATKDATLKEEAEAKDATAKAAAEAASQRRQAVHAAVTTNGTTATVDQLSPVDATAEARTIKLATGEGAGHIVAIEKKDSSANTVTIEGNIRGEAAQTIVLKYAKEVFLLETDSSGSWWVIGRYIALSSIKAETRQVLRRSVSIPAGQVPGNEVVLDEYVNIASGETRKIVWFEVHTTSGTITVKVGRGEAGSTEIEALNALEATSSIKLKTGLSISLSDKDRLKITLSAGSSPKGLTITWGEEVVAP